MTRHIILAIFALIYTILLDYLRDNYGLNYIGKSLILIILVGITYDIIEKVSSRASNKTKGQKMNCTDEKKSIYK